MIPDFSSPSWDPYGSTYPLTIAPPEKITNATSTYNPTAPPPFSWSPQSILALTGGIASGVSSVIQTIKTGHAPSPSTFPQTSQYGYGSTGGAVGPSAPSTTKVVWLWVLIAAIALLAGALIYKMK